MKPSEYWDSVFIKDRNGFFRNGSPASPYHRFTNISLLHLLTESAKELRGKRILFTDLYSEAGGVSELIDEVLVMGGEVFGIDISVEVVRSAGIRYRGKKVRLCACDLSTLPFRDSSFDFIFSHSTIDHIEEPSIPLKEVFRVLKDGGRALVTGDNGSNPLVYLSMLLLKRFYRFRIETIFNRSLLEAICKEAGFKVERMGGTFLIPPLLPTISESLLKISSRFPKPFERAISSMFHAIFTLSIQIERLAGEGRLGEIGGKYLYAILEK